MFSTRAINLCVQLTCASLHCDRPIITRARIQQRECWGCSLAKRLMNAIDINSTGTALCVRDDVKSMRVQFPDRMRLFLFRIKEKFRIPLGDTLLLYIIKYIISQKKLPNTRIVYGPELNWPISSLTPLRCWKIARGESNLNATGYRIYFKEKIIACGFCAYY